MLLYLAIRTKSLMLVTYHSKFIENIVLSFFLIFFTKTKRI